MPRDSSAFEHLLLALALADEPEQDVLGTDVVVVEHLGLFLGQDDNATGAVRESLEHLLLLGRRRSWSVPM